MLQNSARQPSHTVKLTLHANVSTEASLGDDVAIPALVVTLLDTSKLESDAVGDD
jgi:hypothetical protein